MDFKLKDYNLNDTISAIATFPSKSALGVIKISGKKALAIISQIFKPAKKKDIRKAKTYTLHYGWIVDRGQKEIDEVLVSIMRKPYSYTKEDVIEISGHGGIVVLNKILEIILERGASRLALPGEFTYRALIRGRIDLLQAEGILGVVEAKTDKALILASAQLKGQISWQISKLKEKIKDLFVYTESLINFPEEDINFSSANLKKDICNLEKKISRLLEASQKGKIMQEGLRCVICGKANVGKSTLFNCLLRQERVLVSRISGTTRDVIEETINIKGIPLRIYDTAGILEPKDLLAKKAMEKSSEALKECDLVILLLDGSRPLNKDDFFLLETAKDKDIILVINKSDLPAKLDLKNLPKNLGKIVKLSALKNRGLAALETAVYQKVYQSKTDRENIIFLSQYQQQVLKKINQRIKEANSWLKHNQPIDFINLTLKECLEDLGKLNGEVYSQEILESIFSKFCIGK